MEGHEILAVFLYSLWILNRFMIVIFDDIVVAFQCHSEDVVQSEIRKNSDALAGLPPPLTAERRISADVDMDPCKAGTAATVQPLKASEKKNSFYNQSLCVHH